MRALTILIVALSVVAPGRADVQDLIKNKRHKILFLGDSNTYAGMYIAYVEGYLRTRFPDEPWELINLGLPSETVSGLSEPDHPYPRPDVHERIDRALAKVKPNVVFICYGMNDGIYYPFSEERLAKYKEGTEKLVAKIEKAGAKAILMTPAPFDATPVAKNLLPKDAPKFSWMKPYEKYDDVLRQYSDYLLEWRKKDYIVIDAHAAVHRFLKTIREKEPKYTVSGDGIHPNPTGHALIAFEILRELKAPAEFAHLEIDFKAQKVVKGKADKVKAGKDSITFEWQHNATMPIDSRWDARLERIEKFQTRFNQHVFKVTGLPDGKYEIPGFKGDLPLLDAQSLALANGIRLFDSTQVASTNLCTVILKKRQLLDIAWLTDVGHKRPDTPKGLPLAEAQEKAAPLEERIHRLTRPKTTEVTVRRKE